MIYILAGTHYEAQTYAIENSLKSNEWTYLTKNNSFFFRIPCKFIKVGTWYMRDNDELAQINGVIQEYVDFHGCEEISE